MALVATIAQVSACEGLRDGPKGVVTEIVDGDTVLLDNGLVVRLVGIQAPHLALGRADLSDWPMGKEARQALAEIVLKKPVMLAYGGAEKDRYGRSLGQLFVVGEAGPVWVQEAMLKAGMARAYGFADNRACMLELLAAEGRARLERLGIWGDSYYSVRRADRPAELLELEGHYELVEGRVLLAEESQGVVFLNFGRFWKEDFTTVIDRGGLKLFAEAGIDPRKFGGALIRVRGWVDIKDGPRIDVTHPEQIEILATP
jgi:endonuclease YncB( thermonuclease family)